MLITSVTMIISIFGNIDHVGYYFHIWKVTIFGKCDHYDTGSVGITTTHYIQHSSRVIPRELPV